MPTNFVIVMLGFYFSSLFIGASSLSFRVRRRRGRVPAESPCCRAFHSENSTRSRPSIFPSQPGLCADIGGRFGEERRPSVKHAPPPWLPSPHPWRYELRQ